jgi:RNA polymerase sigma-70 factor (ECF subfamily)
MISSIPAPSIPLRPPINLGILALIDQRGTLSDAGADETSTDVGAGMETSLMALFRDCRGAAEFQALYEYTRGGLLGWITALVRNWGLGEDPLDLLQDTFVNIYRYAGGFRDEQPASFRVWSRRIAANVARRARMRRSEGSLESMPEGLQEPVDRRCGPSECLCRSEEERSLARAWMIVLSQYSAAVRKLRDRDRLALDLIEVRGLSYAQAAARLRVGPSNMKMIVFRARKRIRADIARGLEGSRRSGPRAAF